MEDPKDTFTTTFALKSWGEVFSKLALHSIDCSFVDIRVIVVSCKFVRASLDDRRTSVSDLLYQVHYHVSNPNERDEDTSKMCELRTRTI